jgi:hypothetical protein
MKNAPEVDSSPRKIFFDLIKEAIQLPLLFEAEIVIDARRGVVMHPMSASALLSQTTEKALDNHS